MILCEDTSIVLQPLSPPVPFGLILSRWLRAKFEPTKCREELEKIVERKCILQDFFRPSEIEQGGLVATDELLFNFLAKDRKWICWFSNQYKGKSFKAGFTSEEVATVASLIRSAAQTTDVDAFKFNWSSVVSDELLEALCSAYSSTTRYGQWPRVDAPGIYRREHASLVIRSQTTTILVDPQCLNFGWTTNNSKFPAEQGLGVVDAIRVTHSHNDHWHLPSILRYVADTTTPVIVPHVPRVNLLTEEDFSASLELVGQKAYAPEWYSTLKIGDIEIDILPFYGEQPTRHPP